MSPKQGLFESDDDFRERVSREADEQTIENSTGTKPSQGWFESGESYRERLSTEANELRIESSSGSAPSQGWFESDDKYRDRIHREANECTVEESTGSAPSQGWLETDADYDTRIRRQANQIIVRDGTGSTPRQGWFESEHSYRSRIAHEARGVRAAVRPGSHDGVSRHSSASALASTPRVSLRSRADRVGAGIGATLFLGYVVSVLGLTLWDLGSHFSGRPDSILSSLGWLADTGKRWWSPTGDAILNFLVNSLMLLIGAAVALGVVVCEFALLLVGLVIAVLIGIIVWLAGASPTGTVLVVLMGVGVVVMILRSFRSK